MRSSLIALLLVVAVGGAIGWYGWSDEIVRVLQNTVLTAQNTLEEAEDVLTPARQVITPAPLRGPRSGQLGQLTAAGVLTFTNQHRADNAVAALQPNTSLDAAAQNKLADMFARQYFDHVSPTGEGPADVVDGVGYEYIRVGENLALGNFASDEALVQAWMDSPGHRANILDAGFQEIGIAVGMGTFEGQQTWIGVQTFATPASVCATPSETATSQIKQNRAMIDGLHAELSDLRDRIDELVADGNATIDAGNAEIAEGNRIFQETGDEAQARPHWERGEALQAEGRAKHTEAQELQAEHNKKIAEFNQLLAKTQQLVDSYNQQVRSFNTCVESFS